MKNNTLKKSELKDILDNFEELSEKQKNEFTEYLYNNSKSRSINRWAVEKMGLYITPYKFIKLLRKNNIRIGTRDISWKEPEERVCHIVFGHETYICLESSSQWDIYIPSTSGKVIRSGLKEVLYDGYIINKENDRTLPFLYYKSGYIKIISEFKGYALDIKKFPKYLIEKIEKIAFELLEEKLSE